ncbi:MAG TPA: hypothetical protein VNJ46_09895 [Gaiellaceae bacterium]|nr:hypothetical protein [Gaiellaceae bacterium]
MDQLLGLLLLAVYIAGVVALAALVTFAVIKLFPTERTPTRREADEAPSGDGPARGRLFRRARRSTA